MHPLSGEDYYRSVRAIQDSNKIRGYNGGLITSGGAEANGGNSKRGRKISKFMPMRGKKDPNGQQSGTTLDNLINAYSIVPLIKMRLLESSIARQQEQLDGEQQASVYNNNNNDNSIATLKDGGEQQPDHSIGEPANMNQYLDADEASQSGTGQSTQFIQNKLRRAFHPMRGKKSIMDEFTPADPSVPDPLPFY